MIEFRGLDDNDPTLVHSPLLRAVEKTFSYLKEHGRCSRRDCGRIYEKR